MNTPCPMCDGMCCRTEIHRIPANHSTERTHVCPGCQNGTAPLIDFKRLKAMFNELDTLHTEIGYALEGKEVPKGKDELLDRVIELRDARRLDNEDLARAYDVGRDKQRAAVVALLSEVEQLRGERDQIREAWAAAQVRIDCGTDAIEAVREERAAVVAWLRWQAEVHVYGEGPLHVQADIIERGEHRREEKT